MKRLAAVVLAVAAGCGRPDSSVLQGYVEGEFVYVASPVAGALETLAVSRGAEVKAGDPLFALAAMPEEAARDEARRRSAQAAAVLEDLRKGGRPSEIASLEAQLEEARAARTFAESEVRRHEQLAETGAVAEEAIDRARSQRDQARQRALALEADLTTARLGARPDRIAAAEADLHALEATLARREWELAQKRQAAPQGGRVFDTLYRAGEWVAAGRPVVVLLPPGLVRVRAFVPETRLGGVQVGARALVTVDGAAAPVPATVAFVSPRAEFTPPVIYSRESRSKLVFMIELTVDPAAAAGLHPGQPVDVRLEPAP